VTPTSGASPIAASPAVPQRLLPPANASRTLVGHVTLDALAIAARGAITLAANGQTLAASAGGVISTESGGKLVGSGGTVLALANGNLIPSSASGVDALTGGQAGLSADNRLLAAGGIISDNGGGVISNHGGSIVANNAGNIVSNNGGSLGTTKAFKGLAIGPVSRGLLDTGSGATATLDTATAVPLAGVLVSAISLKTHAYLPVGVDASGSPVYSVFTDLGGRYELYLPNTDLGTVMIAVTPAPGNNAQVSYNTLAPTSLASGGSTLAVTSDEDSDLAVQTMREAFVDNMALVLTSQDAGPVLTSDLGNNPLLRPAFASFVAQLNASARSAGVPQGPDAARIPAVRQLAYLLCDTVLANGNADQIQLSATFQPGWQGSPETVSQGLRAAAHALRVQTARYMATFSPADTAQLTYVVDARLRGHDGESFCPVHVVLPLHTPADLMAYSIGLDVKNDDAHGTTNVGRAYTAVTVPRLDAAAFDHAPTLDDPVFSRSDNPDFYQDAVTGQKLRYSERVQASLSAIIGSIGLSLAAQGNGGAPTAVADDLATLRQFASSHSFKGSPAPVPTPRYTTLPCVSGP
jgi:hypothetical protein